MPGMIAKVCIMLFCITCITRSAPLTDDVVLTHEKGNVTGKSADCIGMGMGGGYGRFRRMGGYGGFGGGRLVGGGGQSSPMIIVINTGSAASTATTTAASAALRRSARLRSQNKYNEAQQNLQTFLQS